MMSPQCTSNNNGGKYYSILLYFDNKKCRNLMTFSVQFSSVSQEHTITHEACEKEDLECAIYNEVVKEKRLTEMELTNWKKWASE